MLNKMNQQKAVTKKINVADKGVELFGNWELEDELDDADLDSVVGGVVGIGLIVGAEVRVSDAAIIQ